MYIHAHRSCRIDFFGNNVVIKNWISTIFWLLGFYTALILGRAVQYVQQIFMTVVLEK